MYWACWTPVDEPNSYKKYDHASFCAFQVPCVYLQHFGQLSFSAYLLCYSWRTDAIEWGPRLGQPTFASLHKSSQEAVTLKSCQVRWPSLQWHCSKRFCQPYWDLLIRSLSWLPFEVLADLSCFVLSGVFAHATDFSYLETEHWLDSLEYHHFDKDCFPHHWCYHELDELRQCLPFHGTLRFRLSVSGCAPREIASKLCDHT